MKTLADKASKEIPKCSIEVLSENPKLLMVDPVQYAPCNWTSNKIIFRINYDIYRHLQANLRSRG